MIPGRPGRLVTMVMFGAAAFHVPRRPWLVMSLSIVWTIGYGLFIPQAYKGLSVVTDLVIMGVAPVSVGHALRLRGERVAQAARLDHAEARRAMAEDRAVLARDVHDSVGHHLTAIHMQATAIRRALRGQAPTADRALGTIAELSSAALKEVRALLDTLREAPATPGLEEIEDLAARRGSYGLPRCAGGAHQRRPPFGCHQGGGASAAQPDRGDDVDHGQRPRPCRSGGARHQGHARTRTPAWGNVHGRPGPQHGWLVEAVVPITKGLASPKGQAQPSSAAGNPT
ncbi:histidine kinase [Nonomuraea mesophila]|uniref:histidine kinase n=1 Tax=Nonomuraea mesophila TaxID=2530382 RepID=A0A4V2Z8R6_9ACTN|nr:histidine kinase dimerization/phosphoacceptor domain-containing protein [Nonomuraea mesophila]TDE41396.1 histidine kinase [Nonomuraea mesophila]